MKDTAIIGAISALLVEILAGEQSTEFDVPVTPLKAGRILLGREHLMTMTSPSQVVFIPVRSSFGPPSTKSNTVVVNGVKPGLRARVLRRPVATDMAQYDVHCWGQSNPADTERDFDATRFLAHSVMLACTLLAQTSMELTPGEWIDQQEGAAQMVKAGHRFRFGVTLHMPVADSSVQRTKPGTVLGQPTIAVTHGVTA